MKKASRWELSAPVSLPDDWLVEYGERAFGCFIERFEVTHSEGHHEVYLEFCSPLEDMREVFDSGPTCGLWCTFKRDDQPELTLVGFAVAEIIAKAPRLIVRGNCRHAWLDTCGVAP